MPLFPSEREWAMLAKLSRNARVWRSRRQCEECGVRLTAARCDRQSLTRAACRLEERVARWRKVLEDYTPRTRAAETRAGMPRQHLTQAWDDAGQEDRTWFLSWIEGQDASSREENAR
jgi:hypothetical protein